MRYIIGIDLGTTNSAVAYVDRLADSLVIRPFSIPQFVSLGRADALSALPSFCYLITKEEWPAGSLKLPWKEETFSFVGQFAKVRGSQIPTRLVQSAKSWLCNSAANRQDKILPIEASDPSLRLSPVEATSKYLIHIKDAWNASLGKGDPRNEFEEQQIILTVPASFDEVARALTQEAAKLAGITHLTFLEEPQAAYYSWISQHENEWKNTFKAGNSILVCDVGGGTTDFSLIEVLEKNGGITFQRKAVGEHLLLGGDNMDAAVAHFLEQKLIAQGLSSLDSFQWNQLYAEARSAKEHLLQPDVDDREVYTVVLQGSGSQIIRNSVTIGVEKRELRDLLLNGFFGDYDLESALRIRKSHGLKTMGLPYEAEPSIVKQMACFLQQAHYLESGVDYLLFNGGTMKSSLFQNAMIHALQRWFPEKNLQVLTPSSLDLAVARGAAYYGKAREGHGTMIGGGIPRTYYLEIQLQNALGAIEFKALTLLPRGSEEGSSYESSHVFSVSPNQPVTFRLFTSHTRLEDKQGEMVAIDETEMRSLPPIHTFLRFGRKQGTQEATDAIPVVIKITLTPIGTLELELKSKNTQHIWKLEFQLRGDLGNESHEPAFNRKDETFDSQYIKEAQQLIENVFSGVGLDDNPKTLMDRLEKLLGQERNEWSSSVLRGLWDSLIKCAPRRKVSGAYEIRWWNLAGYFLRPGFGFPLDDVRIKEIWKILLSELKQPKSEELQIQFWIFYRRIAGGLNKGQQMQLASELLASLFNKKNAMIEIRNKNEQYAYSEKIRALASFERLDFPIKIRLGEGVLERILHDKAGNYDYWALGRLGARHLLYASIGHVLPREVVTKWIEQLLAVFQTLAKEQLYFTLAQLAYKTDHRELNISDALMAEILAKDSNHVLKDLIFQTRALTQSEKDQVFGDHLPSGLLLRF